MSATKGTWSLRRVAKDAGVLPKVARDAASEGVIDIQYLVENDVVLVRLYGALKRLVWPQEVRPANADQGLRIWEQIAIETVRAALPDGKVARETGLFVHRAGCEMATDPGAKCTALFKLAEEPFYYAPIGRWFEELPSRRPADDGTETTAA